MYRAVIFDFFGVIWKGGFRPGLDPAVMAIIKSLAGHYKLGLLSNSSPGSLRQYHLEEYFDAIIVSGEVGLLKPDPAIFRLALEQLRVDAKEVIFIDDIPANVVAAQKLGITGVVYSSARQLAGELEKLGVLREG